MEERITITTRFQFCAGHRVYMHESKCANLHGHNYVAWFTISAPALDPLGRVIDFGDIRGAIRDWIETNWDHGYLYFNQDRELVEAFNGGPFSRLKHWCTDYNPTAENLAQDLCKRIQSLCLTTWPEHNLRIDSVQLDETENCSATYRAEL